MQQGRRNWVFFLVVILTVIAVDQISKRLIVDHLIVGESLQPIPALAPFFQITYIHNEGAAFGFLPQASDLFLVIAIVVVAAMFYFYPRIPPGAWLARFATGLVVAGALGNALDRLQYGLVIDFIHYQIPGLISNVSNLADHAIVIGVGLIFIDSWLTERRQKQAEQSTEQPEDSSSSTDETAPTPQETSGE